MKVPLSWLKDFLDINSTPQAIADALTLAGLEVEGIDGDILEVALTPNLGHCMSIYGIARELSAILNLPLKDVDASVQEKGNPTRDSVRVSLIDKRQALRYCCRLVRSVHVGPSPEWLKKRLESVNIRSINTIVDVGNYVMLELGQPLHMFDADLIDQNQIIVTSQTQFSSLKTLDEMQREIPPEALLICDHSKPLAFAGVMGGLNSSVTDQTRSVLIEAAVFTPQSVRKTSKLLSLRTDSSQRFEKGVDPNAVITALNRAASLLQEITGGVVAPGIVDAKAHAFEPKKIACRINRVNALLGTELSLREASEIFKRLGFSIFEEGSGCMTVQVPTFRNDISVEIDLIEEVARIYGYNNIPKSLPRHIASTLLPAPMYSIEKKAREHLMAEGLQECITCDLISPQQAEMGIENALPKESLISVLAPSSVDQSVLRASLLPGLLQVIQYNHDHSNDDLSLFEIGRIHFREGDAFQELSIAGIAITGKSSPYHWDPKPRKVDFFDLKGIVINFLAGFHIEQVDFIPSHLHNFHPGRQASIKIGDQIIGVLGEIKPNHARKIGIDERVYFAEINLHDILRLAPQAIKVAPITPFPGSERDWTITLPNEVAIAKLFTIIQDNKSPLLEKVYLLDLYKSEQIGQDRRNITLRFFYRDQKATIAFETVEKEHERLIQAAAQQLKKEVEQ